MDTNAAQPVRYGSKMTNSAVHAVVTCSEADEEMTREMFHEYEPTLPPSLSHVQSKTTGTQEEILL